MKKTTLLCCRNAAAQFHAAAVGPSMQPNICVNSDLSASVDANVRLSTDGLDVGQ